MDELTDQYYIDILSSMKEVECETCQKSMLVKELDDYKYECQNCYITRLEYIKLEEKDGILLQK